MKYYFISCWSINGNRILNRLVDYCPLEWQSKNWQEFTLISWQEISKDEYNKYLVLI